MHSCTEPICTNSSAIAIHLTSNTCIYCCLTEVVPVFSSCVSSDSNWTEGIDDPSDTTAEEEGDMGDAQPERLSLAEGIALLAEIEKNPSAWPTWIRS